ncbi:MAG TPA: Gldg family protein [Anaerovoracaceae bacterium]|nr:Gldg family protein [Anaerovoracaceae bacterium]
MKNRLFQTKLYFWILIIILIAGVFLLNFVLNLLNERHELSFDLTSNELFDISEESKELIASLKDDIKINVLAKEVDFVSVSTYMAQANEVIRQYDKLGRTITVDYVNYVADPTFASKYPDVVMAHGDILVTCGNKHRVITTKELFNYTYDSKGNAAIASSKADQVLSAALLNVTGDEQVLVTILTGNGEYSMPSFESLLKNNNFEVTSKNLVTEDLDPNCKLAVLVSPHSDLSPEVINKLDKFLYNKGEYGKTLLYTADAEQRPLPNLDVFLKEWGVKVGDGAVFETKENRVFNYHPFYAVADYVDETYQGMLRDKTTPMLMPISRPLKVLFDYRNNNSTTLLLQFGESAAVRPSDAPDSFTQADAAIRGPIPALVLASYSINDKETGKVQKQSNILVSGSSGMLDAYSIDNSSLSNSEYLLNVFNTLAERKETVKIQSKTITGNELNISTAEANWLGLIFALLIPLAILAMGVGIWLFRRHK